MTDSALNYYLASGTNAARLAFTPSPPTPASGPGMLYIWYETDTGNTYAYHGGSWSKVNTGGGGSGGLYDISMGVPAAGSLTVVGDTTHHTLTQNGTAGLNVKYTSNAGSVREITGWKLAITAPSPYQFAILVAMNMSDQNYYGAEAGFYNSSNGKFRTFNISTTVSPGIETWTAYNNRVSASNVPNFFTSGLFWMHVGYDGTNLTYGFSQDGATPFIAVTEPATTNLGGAPTDVFFGMFTDPLEGGQVLGQNVSILAVDPNGLARKVGV